MQKKQFKNWLSYLLLVNDERKNAELLGRYFFDRFAESPEHFYQFILYFKTELQAAAPGTLKKTLAEKYLDILSPLCERIGFFEEKSALDDFCFKIARPEDYKKIDRILAEYKKKSKKHVGKIIATLSEVLREKDYACEVKGRYKNLYSIYRKLQKKRRENVLGLNDIFAFRVISKKNSIRQCFNILNLFHDRFLPVVTYFKDYITIPKINGYQSLHTGLREVTPGLDLPIEVQIRTQGMDEFAERGLAAHWVYADTKESKLLTEKERQLMNYFSSVSSRLQKEALVYFFSSKGDIFKLEEGSSIVDFAYLVHTELGNKALAGVVNGRSKPLSYLIHHGDRIEVKTATTDQVNEDWLRYAKSKHAIHKITEYLKHYGSKKSPLTV